MNTFQNKLQQYDSPLIKFHDSSPRLKGPLYFKNLHNQFKEFLINQLPLFQSGSQAKIFHKNLRINVKPFIIPDLMGKSQLELMQMKTTFLTKPVRSKSSDEQTYGQYCNKYRRLISKGLFYVKQTRHKKIIHQLKIYVRAVQLLLTYFKFKKTRSQNQKNTKRLSKQRISIPKLRKQSGQSTLITLPQQYQVEALQMFQQLHYESQSEMNSPLSQPPLLNNKQKPNSQINFQNFLKRPIQQFIKNKNLSSLSEHQQQTCRAKRTCKTEYSLKRYSSMRQLHRKLQLSQVYMAFM